MTLNSGYNYQEYLGSRAKGHTTLSYLKNWFSHSSETLWQQRIENGEVLLDNRVANESEVLSPRSLLVWQRPPWVEKDVPKQYKVIYHDDAIMVVDKPSGLPTMPAGNYLLNTLLSLVQIDFPGATPMHRLGRGTSGLVVFALNKPATATLAKAWRQHQVKKIYVALSKGIANHGTYEIRTPIGQVSHLRLGNVYAATKEGKPSLSLARVLQKSTDVTFFDIEIKTGRPHQIRIHLASVGYPLLGDPLYGPGGLPISEALPGDGGYFLHAQRLEFLHPSTNILLQLNAPLPQNFKDMLTTLKIKSDL